MAIEIQFQVREKKEDKGSLCYVIFSNKVSLVLEN